MIGVSGSGKTTWVNAHKEYVACSTDFIIEELSDIMGISYAQAFDYIQNKKNLITLQPSFLKRYMIVF